MLEKEAGAYIMIGNAVGRRRLPQRPFALYDFNDRILTTGRPIWVNLVQVELGDAS